MTDNTTNPDFPAGSLLMLESGEYGERTNIGLYRVKRSFSFADIPAVGLPTKEVYWDGSSSLVQHREWDIDFRDAHCEEVDFEGLNIDYITTRVDPEVEK